MSTSSPVASQVAGRGFLHVSMGAAIHAQIAVAVGVVAKSVAISCAIAVRAERFIPRQALKFSM